LRILLCMRMRRDGPTSIFLRAHRQGSDLPVYVYRCVCPSRHDIHELDPTSASDSCPLMLRRMLLECKNSADTQPLSRISYNYHTTIFPLKVLFMLSCHSQHVKTAKSTHPLSRSSVIERAIQLSLAHARWTPCRIRGIDIGIL